MEICGGMTLFYLQGKFVFAPMSMSLKVFFGHLYIVLIVFCIETT